METVEIDCTFNPRLMERYMAAFQSGEEIDGMWVISVETTTEYGRGLKASVIKSIATLTPVRAGSGE